ncbi:MAG: magnesium transporter [Tepidisphaeraceae bacterium]
MIGNLLQPEFEEMIAAKQWADLANIMKELDASDVAELIEDLPAEQEGVVFRVLPRDRAGAVFSYLPRETQESLVLSLTNDQTTSIVAGMTPDDRARLLEELPAEVTKRLMASLSPDALKKTRDLLGYPPATAGRYMTPEYAAVPGDLTAAQAIEHIRRTGRGKETLNIVYLIDSEGRLLEDVRLGSLVLALPDVRAVDIDDRPLVSIKPMTPVEEVIQIFEKYDRVALPVVDDAGVMLGIITADDVLEFAQKRATTEIQKIGGSEALDAPYFDVGFLSMCKKRGGWLAALFLGEMLTATAMGHFEAEIEKAAVVALFVPLIISTGGNSGSQATSILIRSLALSEVKDREWWRVFGREILTSFRLGVFLSVVGFVRVSLWYYFGWQNYSGHPYLIGGVVGLSLIGCVMFGSIVGSILPFIFRLIRVDPATASAPFVATLVDVTGLIIYFTVAEVLLRGVLL